MAEVPRVLSTTSVFDSPPPPNLQGPQGHAAKVVTELGDDPFGMTARTSDRALRFTTAAADCPQEGEGHDGRPAGFQVLASSEAPDPAFLRSEQQEYTPTPPPAGRSRAAAAAVAAGDKISKLHRIKKAQVASVSVGRDYDRLFEMIASLDRKIQAIGEIVERELGPAQREDPATPPPPPLRHTLNQFMETCTEKLHMVTTTLNESIKEKARKTDERGTAAKTQQHLRCPPAPPGPPGPGPCTTTEANRTDAGRKLYAQTTQKPAGGVSYAAMVAAPPPPPPPQQNTMDWTTVNRRKRPGAAERPLLVTPAKDLRMEQRRFAFVRDNGISTARCQPADIQSAINRALCQERVPHSVRVQEVRRNDRGTITGATIPTASAEMLLNYRDTVIRAARTQDAGIVGVELNEIWKRVKIHGIPLARYVGKGTHGTEKLREEIEAENEGVTIPLVVRWLGKLADIKARAMRGEISASSITFVVRGEGVANRLIKNGLRIIGKIYQVEAYEEARPDAMCRTCCGWGHVEAQCAPAKKPKMCPLC